MKDVMAEKEPSKKEAKLQIFRAANAPSLFDSGIMSAVPGNEMQEAGYNKMYEAGFGEGEEIKVLINVPGSSLVQVWFKKNFPLPLHSHDVDCLYYVIAGSISLGTEDLGPGDGFFIKADTRYTYRTGPKGAEILEIRTAQAFNFVDHTKNPDYFDNSLEVIADNLEDWRQAKRPSEQ